MGAWISRYKKSDDGDYEKILSELDAKLQKAELKLSEIKIRERRINVMFTLYGLALWAIYLAYCFATLSVADVPFDTVAMKVAPVFLLPVIIYFGRRGLKWFYSRKQTNEGKDQLVFQVRFVMRSNLYLAEANVSSLRAQQKLKVEELKNKTAYYSTKLLLERYDQSSKPKPKPSPPAQNKSSNNAHERKPQFPQAPSSQGPLLQGPAPIIQNNPLLHRPAQPNMPPPQSGQPGQLGQPMQQLNLRPAAPVQRQWYDKLVDALVGEDGPETKYALICNHCSTHNGLVLPQEIETIQYICPKCGQFNPSRRSRQLHPGGPVLPPSVSPAQSRSTSPNVARSLSRGSETQRAASRTRDQSRDSDRRRGRSTSSRRVIASSDNIRQIDENEEQQSDEHPASPQEQDSTEGGSAAQENDTIASRVRQRKKATTVEHDNE